MHCHGVEVVHPEGAREARGVLGPGRVLGCGLRIEHRVVDHQLSAPVEKLIERPFALRPLEPVLLVDQLPRHVAPRLAQLVAELRELLLLDEVPLARLDPFLVRNDLVLHASYPPTAEPTIRNKRLRMLPRTATDGCSTLGGVIPNAIEKEVVIEAPLEVVWRVVTDPEQIRQWFADEAEVKLRVGGSGRLRSKSGDSYELQVEALQPPRRFPFRWLQPEGAPARADNSMLVEFTLEPEAGGTRLRVVESGFDTVNWSDAEKAKS